MIPYSRSCESIKMRCAQCSLSKLEKGWGARDSSMASTIVLPHLLVDASLDGRMVAIQSARGSWGPPLLGTLGH